MNAGPRPKRKTGSRPILCLDFDGVLHWYRSGWQSAEIIDDEPTPGAVDFVRMMSGNAQEFWVKAVGKNTVPGATFKNFVAELYRWSPPPSETMSLIQDGQSRLESPVAGSVLADTTKADTKKFPKHTKDQKCNNCALYQGKATDATGGCPLFAGKVVAGAGWCSAWAKKA